MNDDEQIRTLEESIKKYNKKIRKYATENNQKKGKKYRGKRDTAQRELDDLLESSSSEESLSLSDHESDDGAAEARAELEDHDAVIKVQKEVWFTDGSRATVHFELEDEGKLFWTWSKQEHPDGYYTIVPPAHGESKYQLELEEETTYLTIDRKKTNHQTLNDLNLYVKGSGAVQRQGYDAADMVSAKFSQLYLK